MVVEFEGNKVTFEDKPNEWHEFPAAKTGLMMITLMKEACDRHMPFEPPPPPELTKDNKRVQSSRHQKETHATLRPVPSKPVTIAKPGKEWRKRPVCHRGHGYTVPRPAPGALRPALSGPAARRPGCRTAGQPGGPVALYGNTHMAHVRRSK